VASLDVDSKRGGTKKRHSGAVLDPTCLHLLLEEARVKPGGHIDRSQNLNDTPLPNTQSESALCQRTIKSLFRRGVGPCRRYGRMRKGSLYF